MSGNNLDKNYTVYLKCLTSPTSNNIKVFSSNKEIANPKIAFMPNIKDLRIAWQIKVNNTWQIYFREFVNDTLTNVLALTDSSDNNITPTINTNYTAWINNGNLLYQRFDSLSTKPKILDSLNCSNPELYNSNYINDFQIVYEKGAESEKQIYMKRCYKIGNVPHWNSQKISSNSNNINPHFNFGNVGINYISYQAIINGKWVIMNYDGVDSYIFYHSSYNCENPIEYLYSYLMTKSSTFYNTPSFFVFDSDSIKENKEIFLKTISYYPEYPDTLINLSNEKGDDYSPHIVFYKPNDTLYISILWIHDENGKKDIWISKAVFNPYIDDVKDHPVKEKGYLLNQNYPNPFNPSTTIHYKITDNCFVKLFIYDELGRKIKTLVNKNQNRGEYNIRFNGNNLSSGIYYYRLLAGKYVSVKKMLLLK